MVSKILIDTNVLLDYLLEREPFFEDAKKVISSCTEGNTKGCIAAHSISNMFFILRKDYTAKESTLKNTLLTDYISAASGDSDVKKFGVGGVYAPANSIALYRMYSSYLNIVPKDQLPIDMEKLNDAILGERGYYAMLLLDEKEPKNVLRFNIAGFKNRYHLADLAKMNLVYYGVKVGTCTKEQLSIENEFTVTTSTMQETISVDEIINGSSQEKTSSKELNVYDIVLAGVIRE